MIFGCFLGYAAPPPAPVAGASAGGAGAGGLSLIGSGGGGFSGSFGAGSPPITYSVFLSSLGLGSPPAESDTAPPSASPFASFFSSSFLTNSLIAPSRSVRYIVGAYVRYCKRRTFSSSCNRKLS